VKQPQIPPGTKKIVIFDTNAYRDLTFGLSLAEARAKALRLRALEQKAGNFALASPIVIWELIAHLGNISDLAYPYCLNALVALAEHTWSPFDPNAGICLFADAASTVCRELFLTVPPIAVQNVQNLSKLAAYVKKHAPNLTLPAALTNLKVFSMELAKREKQWLTDMQKILTDCDPKIAKPWIGGKDDKDVRQKLRSYFASPAFMDAWAAITVVRHANMLGVKLTPAELSEKAKAIRKIFPVPFHLMSALLQKFPTPQPMNLSSPKRNRGNFMCDTAICFSIGGFHEVDGASMFLVTADRAIKDAANVAQCPDRVVTLTDYRNSVGLQ
jgi:hypothetical protein